MSDYKFNNAAGTAVLKYPDTTIVEGGRGWNEYLDYVSRGGETAPWKTDEELKAVALADKLAELKAERDSRIDTAVGTNNPRKKDKIISRAVKLLRRELKATITAQEQTELDAMESLDDHLEVLDGEHDTAVAWLEDSGRTIEEIQNYDVITGPGWSALS